MLCLVGGVFLQVHLPDQEMEGGLTNQALRSTAIEEAAALAAGQPSKS